MKYLIIALLFLSSCITQEKCLERFPPKTHTETVTNTVYKDSLIQGATIQVPVPFEVQVPGEPIIYTDTSGFAELRFYRDAYGNLIASCEAKDRQVQGLIKEFASYQKETDIHEIKYVPWWLYAILGITTVGTLLFLISRIIAI